MFSISIEGETKGRGRKVLLLFSSFFVVLGVVLTYQTFGRPFLILQAAQAWTTSSCVISKLDVISSENHRGRAGQGRGSTIPGFRVEVSYDYVVDGVSYVGNVLEPFKLWSSQKRATARAASLPRAGESTPCYIDPSDPTNSMIDRDFSTVALLGLLPILFTFGGLLFLILLCGGGQSRVQPLINQGIRIKAPSRVSQLALLVILALIVNFIGFCEYIVSSNWEVPWALHLFMVLVGVIGALLILAIIYRALRMFVPSVDLELDLGVPQPGSSLTISWRLCGLPSQARGLEINLEAYVRLSEIDSVEAAQVLESQFQQGIKDGMIGEKKIVIPILETQSHSDVISGSRQIMVPTLEEIQRELEFKEIKWRITTGILPRRGYKESSMVYLGTS